MPIRMLHTAQVGPRLWWDLRSEGASSLRFAEQRGKAPEKILLSWCFKPGLTSNLPVFRVMCLLTKCILLGLVAHTIKIDVGAVSG